MRSYSACVGPSPCALPLSGESLAATSSRVTARFVAAPTEMVSGLLAPAPGYRHANYGTLYNVGNNGYSWASSVVASGSNAYFLNFNSGGLNPQNSNNRANGLQVRCLQHLSRGVLCSLSFLPLLLRVECASGVSCGLTGCR